MKFKLLKKYKSDFPVYNSQTEVLLRFLAYLATSVSVLCYYGHPTSLMSLLSFSFIQLSWTKSLMRATKNT